MAEAWTVYTKTPGVCLVTAGPGFMNALTGIANACMNNVPMVILSGRHPLRDDLKGALQELNQVDIVRPIVKWCASCHDPGRIPEYLSIAFRQAVQGRPGPVFLELPPEVLNAKMPLEGVTLPPSAARRYRAHARHEDLVKAADIISGAKAPLLLGGSGVRIMPVLSPE